MLASSGRDPTDVAACSKVGTNSGESWRLAPALMLPMGMPFPSTAVERLVPCLPLSAGLLSPARRFGDAPVHRHLRKLKTDESVVGRERYLPKRLHQPELDPLVASVPNRGGRTPFLGDSAISATEHQDLNELLEDHPVGDARLVAAQRVMDHSVREQGQELLEDGLDDVWWKCGHGLSSLSFGKLGNSPNDRASRARLSSRRLPIRAASKPPK